MKESMRGKRVRPNLRLVPEGHKTRSRSSFYKLGHYESRFAVLWYSESKGVFKPKGGLVLGRLGLWWSR